MRPPEGEFRVIASFGKSLTLGRYKGIMVWIRFECVSQKLMYWKFGLYCESAHMYRVYEEVNPGRRHSSSSCVSLVTFPSSKLLNEESADTESF